MKIEDFDRMMGEEDEPDEPTPEALARCEAWLRENGVTKEVLGTIDDDEEFPPEDQQSLEVDLTDALELIDQFVKFFQFFMDPELNGECLKAMHPTMFGEAKAIQRRMINFLNQWESF